MKNKIVLIVTLLSALTAIPKIGEARQGFTISLGPIGNIFLIDTIPVLDAGVGGHFSFDYRFQDQLSFQTTFFISSQDGSDGGTPAAADNGILFLGMPTFDVKYYLLKDDPRLDPYMGTGVGLYWLSEGSNDNNTGGTGLGAQIVVGLDYYLTDVISLGFSGVFRSVALITSLSSPATSVAIFPYSLNGSIGFHF